MARWVTGKVLDLIWWTPSLFSLKVAADVQPFKAGQFTKLALEVDGKRIARAYSYVNSPHDPTLEFYLIEVTDGCLSQKLARLTAGDDIYIDAQANGFLTIEEIPDAHTLWMLSTGTAIGPFLSILAQGKLWDRFRQVILVHGVRANDDLTYRQQISMTQQAFKQFKYVPVVSREVPEYGLSGRITHILESGELVAFCALEELPKSSHFMICGNPQMVKDTTHWLTTKGFKRHRRAEPGHISVEQYW
ncbi:Flavodoxin/ferredoxin--NADP reductase [Pseudoalteromonas holothuriae]|uniref:ferredoxin--NADP(+) reductase n=1 Tax=Pseudoalteromonas holothuriae TaxID=2963714 RepID=A0ABN8UMD5_9GAMM|nr:ferredoxin--NADP reductase [Pseudoalteromonas sp. CIP111951]CAH9061304.1 Flavodoxin/ferredoxin--NADP reductase [Pseudoalteromonas sp. CIP111951]